MTSLGTYLRVQNGNLFFPTLLLRGVTNKAHLMLINADGLVQDTPAAGLKTCYVIVLLCFVLC